MAAMPTEDASPAPHAELLEAFSRAETAEQRFGVAAELLERYRQDARPQLRHAFLRFVQHDPELLSEASLAHFLAQEISPDDFESCGLETPEQIVSLMKILSGLSYDDDELDARVGDHARALLLGALQRYERERRRKELFELVRLAPAHVMRHDAELSRLRHRAYLDEVRAAERRRRLLHTYLVVQALLILMVFPLLFIYAENGVIQAQFERATDTELPEEPRQYLDFFDGLYWSIITAGSIGYGDITPQTRLGRVIAAFLGFSGVITAGVVAGLVLNWVTPRSLGDA